MKTKKKYREIPLTFDPMFKALLSSEDTREYLALLIEYIVGIPKEDIMNNAVVISGELYKEKEDEKGKNADLLIAIENHIVNIEMNNNIDYKEKNYAYMHKLAYRYYKIKDNYKEGPIIIQINFDSKKTYDNRLVIRFEMMDKERMILDNENFIKYHVNLDNIRLKYYNEKENMSEFERLLSILLFNDKKTLEEYKKESGIMSKVSKKIESLRDDDLINELYEINEIDDRRRKERMMKEATEKGLEKGLKQGLKQGLEQGIEQGIEKGSNEKAISIAKSLLNENIDISIISKTTGLSVDYLEKLK